MEHFIVHSSLNYKNYPNRVCLPYGSNLFDISRWILKEDSSNFEIVVGSTIYEFSKKNLIEIYSLILDKCIGYILESSFIRFNKSRNLIYFDAHERFSFFAGDLEIVQYLFPFERNLIWENYQLYQDEDIDSFKQDIFNNINTVPR